MMFNADLHPTLRGIGHLYGRSAAGIKVLDQAMGSGFAIRAFDIPPWALFGLAASHRLAQDGQIPRSRFLGVALIMLGAAFSMPKRSAVIMLGTAALAFFFSSQTRTDRRWSIVLVIIVIGVVFAATAGTLAYLERQGIGLAEEKVALARLLTLGVIAERGDARPRLLSGEIDELLHNPRLLLLGSGWDFGAGLWSKPHNTYIALLVGGGLVSLIPILIALGHLFQRSPADRRRSPPGTMGIVLLMAMIVELGMNGYLYYRLEFPASNLVMWIAWSAILYRTPPATLTGVGPGGATSEFSATCALSCPR
jgi:hypothetical protein